MLNCKKIVKRLNYIFLLGFLLWVIPLLMITILVNKFAIVALFIVLFLELKEYYQLQTFEKKLIKNENKIDKELKTVYFNGSDYLLTESFIIDLKYHNIINFKNILCVIEGKDFILDPLATMHNVLYIFSKNGIIKLITSDIRLIQNEKYYKADMSTFLKETKLIPIIKSIEEVNKNIAEKTKVRLYKTLNKTWRRNIHEYLFFID